MFTDRVRSTTGRLCFDTCLSTILSVHTWGGGGQIQVGGPQPGPARRGVHSLLGVGGYPTSGTPSPLDLAGGYPSQGVPNLGYPPSDLAGWNPDGGYPTLGKPPVRPGWGYPSQGDPTSGTPLLDLARGYLNGGYSTSGTPPPPSNLTGGGTPTAWGYPTSGSTWYAAVGMPLAFTQEDFLVYECKDTIKSLAGLFQLSWPKKSRNV